jgi:hypothetical protein
MGKKVSPKTYDEGKVKVSIALTPTGRDLLDRQADLLNLSRSELVEQLARGMVNSNPDVQLLGES